MSKKFNENYVNANLKGCYFQKERLSEKPASLVDIF